MLASLRRVITWYSAKSVPLIRGRYYNARTTAEYYTIILEVLQPKVKNIYSWKMTLAICLSCQHANTYSMSVCLSTICQGSTLIHQKVAPPTEGQGSPVLSFIALEQFNAIRLVQVCQITRALTNSKHFTLFQKSLISQHYIIIDFIYWYYCLLNTWFNVRHFHLIYLRTSLDENEKAH